MGGRARSRSRYRRKGEHLVELLEDEDNEDGASNMGFNEGERVPGTDYYLQRLLGSGGFGEVWLVKNPATGNEVVFKFCLPDHVLTLDKATLLTRIKKECERSDFEGFARLLETRTKDKPQFVAYEYVPDGNLLDLINSRPENARAFSPLEAAEIMLQLAKTMAVAHTLSDPIVHRDLKPANILVASSKCVPPKLKIADFGLGGIAIEAAESKSGPVSISGCSRLRGHCRRLSIGDPLHVGAWPSGRDFDRRDPWRDRHVVAVIAFIVFMERAQPAADHLSQASARQPGLRRAKPFLPLKLNTSGVIPPISPRRCCCCRPPSPIFIRRRERIIFSRRFPPISGMGVLFTCSPISD